MVEARNRVDFSVCDSEDTIKSVRNSAADTRAAIMVLIKSCRAALSDLRNARIGLHRKRAADAKQADDDRKRRAAAAFGGAKAPKKSRTAGFQIFDMEPKGGRDSYMIPALESVSQEIDVSAPFLLRFQLMHPAQATEEDDQFVKGLQQELDCFTEDFNNSDLKITQGRASARIESDEVCERINSWFLEHTSHLGFIPPQDLEEATHIDFLAAARPCIFGTAMKHSDARLDMAALPNVRAHISGTRTLVMCRLKDISSFLRVKHPDWSVVRAKQAYAFLKDACAEDVQDQSWEVGGGV